MRDQLIATSTPNAPRIRGAFFFGPATFLAVLTCLVFAIFRLYTIAFSADTGFDDDANLRGLIGLSDADSIWRFVLSGGAGPSGRPLALASFLINAASWPSMQADVLRTNALVHLINTCLVAWLALRLAELLPRRPARPEWFALAVAALWSASPLLMSASLMAVQRMTTLSATACLAGMIGWLAARRLLASDPWRAMALMSGALAVATSTAILCKEIGALLPILVAVTEYGLAASSWGRPLAPAARRAWRLWQALFFGVPVLLLGGSVWLHLSDIPTAFQGRGYGPGERLLAECGILFDYLRYLVLPERPGLGPFHDDFAVSVGPGELLAVGGWLSLCGLALWARRGPWRLGTFALGWFLCGHLLESTIFPLEPYFEHRNYLPAFGIMFGLCAALWDWPGRARAAGRMLLLVLFCNIAFVARELAIVWGDPRLSGPLWVAEHPLSMRALMYHGRTTAMEGDEARALAIFDSAPDALRGQPRYIAARLQLYCSTGDVARISAAADELSKIPVRGKIDFDVAQSIGIALDFAALGRCAGFDPELGRAALEAILDVPGERVMPRALPVAHEILARYWIRQRRLDLSVHHLESEYDLNGSADAIARLVGVLGSARQCESAAAALHDAQGRHGWNPLANAAWTLRLKDARNLYAQFCGSHPANG